MCTKKNGILTEYFGMEELKTFLTNFSEVNTVPKPIYLLFISIYRRRSNTGLHKHMICGMMVKEPFTTYTEEKRRRKRRKTTKIQYI